MPEGDTIFRVARALHLGPDRSGPDADLDEAVRRLAAPSPPGRSTHWCAVCQPAAGE